MEVAFSLHTESCSEGMGGWPALGSLSCPLVVFRHCWVSGGCSTVLDKIGDPSLYGQQRLWGAIGWGWVGAPIAGASASPE